MSRFLSEQFAGMKAYTPGEQPKTKNLIKLNTNESPFPPAPGVAEAVKRAAESLQLYNDLSAAELTALIAEDCGVTPAQVFCGNGSDEVLAFAFQAYGGDGIAFPDITYGCYPVWCDLYGLEKSIIPLREDFSIAPEDYKNAGKTVVIANPNAPTGIALNLDEIACIAASNAGHPVIVDEAYVDFGAESAVKLLAQYDNLMVVRTFSKSRQLAGARLGFALGSEDMIRDLNFIRYSFHPYNVNTLTQAAGCAAMRDRAYFEACLKSVMDTRAWTKAELEKLGFQVTDSRANFLFAKAPAMSGGAYQKALREKNILIRYFDIPRIRDYTRISIGSMEQMEALIQATKELFP